MKFHTHSIFIISMPDAYKIGKMADVNIKRVWIKELPYGHLMNPHKEWFSFGK